MSVQSCLTFCNPWTVAHQVPLSMEFSRQEYWLGCHFLLQEIFPTQGSNQCLLLWQMGSFPLHHLEHSCILSSNLKCIFKPMLECIRFDILATSQGNMDQNYVCIYIHNAKAKALQLLSVRLHNFRLHCRMNW